MQNATKQRASVPKPPVAKSRLRSGQRSPAAIAAAKSKAAAMARIAAAAAEARARSVIQTKETIVPNNVFGVSQQVPGFTPTPPSKPRPKGAPPPVIAKPKPRPKPVETASGSKPPRKKIDFSTATTVREAAIRAGALVKPGTNKLGGGYVVISGRRVLLLCMAGVKLKRKPRKAPATSIVHAIPEMPKFAKTKLNKRELDHYSSELLSRRAVLVGRVRGVEDEALRSNGGNLSTMPLHMADIGSDTFDQDFALGMAEGDRQLLSEIDQAIERIKDKSYGVCMKTGKPIPKARLNATPWAKLTVEAARQSERNKPRS